ncbi:MAG: DUF3606 domain-containing protein [Burkholderiaceae bacterium]|nr:DUF3606 domain-containing protein [Burkholderiaceae bacterium]
MFRKTARRTGERRLQLRCFLHQEGAMPESRIQPGGERQRIDIDREQELEDWARKLDATPQQVKDAVRAVGNRADDVEMHLKGVRTTTNSDETRRANR